MEYIRFMSAIKSETVTHMIIVLGTLVAQIENVLQTIERYSDRVCVCV